MITSPLTLQTVKRACNRLTKTRSSPVPPKRVTLDRLPRCTHQALILGLLAVMLTGFSLGAHCWMVLLPTLAAQYTELPQQALLQLPQPKPITQLSIQEVTPQDGAHSQRTSSWFLRMANTLPQMPPATNDEIATAHPPALTQPANLLTTQQNSALPLQSPTTHQRIQALPARQFVRVFESGPLLENQTGLLHTAGDFEETAPAIADPFDEGDLDAW